MTGLTFITGWKRTALAASLAYALALQGLLLALGGAMHVQAAALPETVLCAANDEGARQDPPGQTDHALCCILACGTSLGPVPASASFEPRRPIFVATSPAAKPWVAVVTSNVLPVGSRAPPQIG